MKMNESIFKNSLKLIRETIEHTRTGLSITELLTQIWGPINHDAMDPIEAIIDELDNAYYAKSSSPIRSCIRREYEGFDWDLNDFMENFTGDAHCRDMDIALNVVADNLYLIRNDIASSAEELEEAYGGIVAGLLAATDCLCQAAAEARVFGNDDLDLVEGHELYESFLSELPDENDSNPYDGDNMYEPDFNEGTYSANAFSNVASNS